MSGLASSPAAAHPDWNALYSTAAAQAGHFTTAQAAHAGYSGPLLHKHQRAGRIRRVQRGIYRLVHYPPTEHEEFVAHWLWSARIGVFSHQTALALHGLSDLLPMQVHLTLPNSWAGRRLRIPQGLVLHFSDIPSKSSAWAGPVPLTVPARTLEDCAAIGLAPDLLRQAAREALLRGMVARTEVSCVRAAMRAFGGLRG